MYTQTGTVQLNVMTTMMIFFSQPVINRWNSLSQDDIDAANVNSFKNRLERRRKCQMGFSKD